MTARNRLSAARPGRALTNPQLDALRAARAGTLVIDQENRGKDERSGMRFAALTINTLYRKGLLKPNPRSTKRSVLTDSGHEALRRARA